MRTLCRSTGFCSDSASQLLLQAFGAKWSEKFQTLYLLMFFSLVE